MITSRHPGRWLAEVRRLAAARRRREMRRRSSMARAHGATGGRRLWRTLAMLVMRPGHLSCLWLRGTRARFLSPLALYLSTGGLFLVALKFFTDGPRVRVDLVDFNLIVRPPAAACTQAASGMCAAIVREAAAMTERRGDPVWNVFAHRLPEVMPTAVFLSLPIFAIIVASLYRNRSRPFAAHLVFAAHLHAFWFLLATLAQVWSGGLAFAVTVVVPGYALCALQEVYGGRWYFTTLRALAVASIHLAVVVSLAAAISFVGGLPTIPRGHPNGYLQIPQKSDGPADARAVASTSTQETS